MRFVLILLLIVWSFSSVANEQCERSLTQKKRPDLTENHEYVIVPSGNGRDNDVVGKYRQFVEEFSRKGGVLDQLGITRTKQIVEFVKGTDMLAITATPAAQPVAHYLDGAQVIDGVNKPWLIYEVVYPGYNYQHGYYRDDNPYEEQLSILMHVIGHNHFAVNTHFPHYRVSNPTEAALKLNRAMMDAYKVAPKEDVENFYLFMQTLSGMSDYHSAFYQSPQDFDLSNVSKSDSDGGDVSSARMSKAILERGLKSSTENIMPAFVQKILSSSQMSEWQKDIAVLWPQLAAYRPALTHTQVMNEGWASLMQELVMDHMGPEHNTVKHWFSAQRVTAWEPHLKLDDPYWLGVRLWKRIRERFDLRDDIKSMTTQIEKDRAFIKYAETEIISVMDDFQFIQFAMDANMIQRMGLVLSRKATPEEAEKYLPPPPPDMQEPEPRIVVSRDPDRIRKSVIEQAFLRKVKFRPRVVLKSYNRNGTGEVEMSIDDDFGRAIPIDQNSVGPSLYALANILRQPMSFEATFKVETAEQKQEETFGPFLPQNGDWWQPPPHQPILVRARVVVTSNGSVTVVVKEDDKKIESQLLKNIETSLHEYIREVHLEDDATLGRIADENPRFEKIAMHSLNQMINGLPVTSLIEHVPTAADAINEYQSKVSARIVKAFELAMRNSRGLVKTPKGLFLKALPSPVDIKFDFNYIQKLSNEAIPTPMDPYSLQVSNPFDNTDSNGSVRGPTDIAPGGGGWVPNPKERGGQGKGKKKGDEDGDSPGQLPGEVGLDPSWVPLPESLYAQFLGEKVKLPHLKPKTGRVKSQKMKLRGRENRRAGQLLVSETVANALRKGMGAMIGDEKDPFDDFLETAETGFSLMRQRDFVVRKMKPTLKPDTNAVVFFARDASASTIEYTPLYKRFVYDMKTLIKSNYPNVQFVYIVFDTQAHVVKTEREFFEMELNGGTSYRAPVQKIRQLMADEYPEAKFDRFPFVIGDLGDFLTPETRAEFEGMVEEASYSGVVKAGYGVDDFTNGMRALATEQEFFGFVDMGDNPVPYSIEHIRKLLKNRDE